MRVSSLALSSVMATVLLSLAACSPAPSSSASPESPSTESPETPQAEATPAEFQFDAITLDGQPFDGTSIYGTPTILWFWAEWCPNCRAEAPFIADALDELPAGVQVIGVPGHSSQEGMEAFVAAQDLEGIVHLVDADGGLWSLFGVASQPAIAVISADGTIRVVSGSVGKTGFLELAESIAD